MILYLKANLERWLYSELEVSRLFPSADKIAAYGNVNKFMFQLNIGIPWCLTHHGKPVITAFWGLRILFREFEKRYLPAITWNSGEWKCCWVCSRDPAKLSRADGSPLGHNTEAYSATVWWRAERTGHSPPPYAGAGTQSQASEDSWALHL